MHVTIYRDNSGLPLWATVAGAAENPDAVKQVGDGIKAARAGEVWVLAHDDSLTLEVI